MNLDKFTAVAYSLRPVLSILESYLNLMRCKAVAYSLRLDLSCMCQILTLKTHNKEGNSLRLVLSVLESNFDFEVMHSRSKQFEAKFDSVGVKF